MAEVCAQNGGREPTAQAAKEAKQRLHDLSTSSDTRGVSFAGLALHFLYFSTKFALRGELLYRALDAALRQHPQLLPLLAQPGGLRVASLGGGPACELAGLCSLLKARRERGRAPAHCTLFDLEVRRSVPARSAVRKLTSPARQRSWRRYLPRLQTLFSPQLQLEFELCDVRFGAPAEVEGEEAWRSAEEVNRRLFSLAPAVRLFVASFVVHETAAESKAGDFACWRGLVRAAAAGLSNEEDTAGALFVLLDVRGSRPVMEAVRDAMMDELGKLPNEEPGMQRAVLRTLTLTSEHAAASEPLPAELLMLHLHRPALAAPPAEETSPAIEEAVVVAAFSGVRIEHVT